MARQSIVEVILKARDQASGVARRAAGNIKSAFNDLGESSGINAMVSKAIGGITPIGAAITAATAVGTAGAATFGAAIGIAEKSTEALNMQLGAANNWSSLTGESFVQSQKVVEDMTMSLAKQAASLPGTTQAYTKMGSAILDNVVGAYTALDGTINKSGATDWIKENVAGLEILRQAAGSTEAQSAKDISRFIGGQFKTEAGLRVSDFFAMNPTLMSNLEKAGKKMGFESIDAMLKNAKQQDLVKILGQATKASVTDDLTKSLAATYDGAKEGIMSSLFDPNTGLLGGLRKFNLDGQVTTMNAHMAQVLNRMSAAFGRIGSHFGKVLEAMGMDSDPLVMLAQFTDWVADMSESLASAIEGVEVGQAVAAIQAIGRVLSIVGQITNMAGIAGIQMGGNLGPAFAGIGVAISGITNYFRTLQADAAAFPAQLNAAGGQVRSFMLSAGAALGRSVMSGLAWLRSLRLPPFPPMPVINFGPMLAGFRSGVSRFVAQGAAAAASFAAGIGSVASAIMAGASAIVAGMVSAASTLAGFAGSVAGVISSGMASVGQAIMSAAQSVISSAISAAQSAIGSIGSLVGLGGGGGGGAVRGRASGQNIGAFQQAMNRERRHMPANSELVVANSSEAIIPRQYLPNVASSSMGQLSAGGPVNLSVALTVNGSQDPQAVASLVMAQIERQYSRARRAALA